MPQELLVVNVIVSIVFGMFVTKLDQADPNFLILHLTLQI